MEANDQYPGFKNTLFGLKNNIETASTIVLPIPWDVTTSYRRGCHKGPKAIINASSQLDTFDKDSSTDWQNRVAVCDRLTKRILEENTRLSPIAEEIINRLENGDSLDSETNKENLAQINQSTQTLQKQIQNHIEGLLSQNKKICLLGGDHSCSLPLLSALNTTHKGFGILQIDAHMDLRLAYEGFTYSHASIMRNALKLENIRTLTQVGIRDYCESEYTYMQNNKDRIHTVFDSDLNDATFQNITWHDTCQRIIDTLPNKVYISLDIDGLDPSNCSNTGTPVPGGLSYNQCIYLLNLLEKSNKTIIGADLVEVRPSESEIDSIIASHLLKKLVQLLD